MSNSNLIRMANQIGVFFESMPDRTEAMRDLAIHLKKFWAPSMRHEFLALLEGSSADQIRDIVRCAAREHRALLA